MQLSDIKEIVNLSPEFNPPVNNAPYDSKQVRKDIRAVKANIKRGGSWSEFYGYPRLEVARVLHKCREAISRANGLQRRNNSLDLKMLAQLQVYKKRGIFDKWNCDPQINQYVMAKYLFDYLGTCANEYELDRINNLKGYFPGNLRWASKPANMRNTTQCVKYRLKNGDIIRLTDYYDYVLSKGKKPAVTRKKFNMRVCILGYSLNKALYTPLSPPIIKDQNRVDYNNLCKANQPIVSYHVYRKRILSGMSKNKAFFTPPKKPTDYQEIYNKYSEMVKNPLSYATFHRAIQGKPLTKRNILKAIKRVYPQHKPKSIKEFTYKGHTMSRTEWYAWCVEKYGPNQTTYDQFRYSLAKFKDLKRAYFNITTKISQFCIDYRGKKMSYGRIYSLLTREGKLKSKIKAKQFKTLLQKGIPPEKAFTYSPNKLRT
jgi:hypothetical protein